jgi:3-oxoacyl-[acyl-carrier protein] reductase
VKKFKDPAVLDDVERVIDVNLRSPLMMTQAVLRFLEGRKRGRIIYLMHDLGRMGLANNSLLAISRSGLSSFARTLSRELAENNITVNCIATGVTEEFLLAQHPGETVTVQEAFSRMTKNFPQATMTEPEKIANMVAFLASPLGAGVTGQTIAVSQGLSFN